MNLDDGAIQRYSLNPDPDDLLALQPLEHPLKDPALRPAVHPGVNGVPVSEALRQTAPFAALLGHIQDRIEHLKVGDADVAPLPGQAVLDLAILRRSDFHRRSIHYLC